MKIDIIPDDGGTIRLREVYNSVVLETSEGNTMAICMRDDGFEFLYKGTWYMAMHGRVVMDVAQHKSDRDTVACDPKVGP